MKYNRAKSSLLFTTTSQKGTNTIFSSSLERDIIECLVLVTFENNLMGNQPIRVPCTLRANRHLAYIFVNKKIKYATRRRVTRGVPHVEQELFVPVFFYCQKENNDPHKTTKKTKD